MPPPYGTPLGTIHGHASTVVHGRLNLRRAGLNPTTLFDANHSKGDDVDNCDTRSQESTDRTTAIGGGKRGTDERQEVHFTVVTTSTNEQGDNRTLHMWHRPCVALADVEVVKALT